MADLGATFGGEWHEAAGDQRKGGGEGPGPHCARVQHQSQGGQSAAALSRRWLVPKKKKLVYFCRQNVDMQTKL